MAIFFEPDQNQQMVIRPWSNPNVMMTNCRLLGSCWFGFLCTLHLHKAMIWLTWIYLFPYLLAGSLMVTPFLYDCSKSGSKVPIRGGRVFYVQFGLGWPPIRASSPTLSSSPLKPVPFIQHLVAGPHSFLKRRSLLLTMRLLVAFAALATTANAYFLFGMSKTGRPEAYKRADNFY